MVVISRSSSSSNRIGIGGIGNNNSKSRQILITIVLCAISYYTGSLTSVSNGTNGTNSSASVDCDKVQSQRQQQQQPQSNAWNEQKQEEEEKEEARIESIVQARVHQLLMEHAGHEQEEEQFQNNQSKGKNKSNDQQSSISLFQHSYSSLMNGMARVAKDDFVSQFDLGPPMDIGKDTDGQDVLVLYNKVAAIPTSNLQTHNAIQFKSESTQSSSSSSSSSTSSSSSIPLLSPQEATENCDTMNVITIGNPGNTNQCTVLLSNYENYHTQRWMRVPTLPQTGKVDHSLPLQHVSRGYLSNGHSQFTPPDDKSIQKHWKSLYKYLHTLDDVLTQLKPIASKVAKNNTIIVMTCNMGQSELLMNFVCSAKAKGLDIDNVLVFPTDKETKDLAEGLGLTTFYDEQNFEDMPEGEAQHYGDKTFIAMMFAKVICVQLINHLGYDLLFQDVDIVWYKNPLDYFHNSSNSNLYNFDIYFQDDGAHSSRYAPYSANSGFYYVRNNPKTKYLFASLLYSGDMIIQSHSHQQALVQIMAEHSSLFGLKVKVFSRETDNNFPGGWHYHRKDKTFMKQIVQGDVKPFIFHMSWTNNKDNKIKFFQQLGQWYVNDVCIGQTRGVILENYESNNGMEEGGGDGGAMLMQPCCVVEPKVVCHYRDKPSKIPCKDSPPIDKGRPSFW